MTAKFEPFRICIYTSITVFVFSILLYWGFYLSTPAEFDLFFWPAIKANMYLCFGFAFYLFKVPERFFTNYYVQLYLHSHMWWHVSIFVGGYALFDLLFRGLIHMENAGNELIN